MKALSCLSSFRGYSYTHEPQNICRRMSSKMDRDMYLFWDWTCLRRSFCMNEHIKTECFVSGHPPEKLLCMLDPHGMKADSWGTFVFWNPMQWCHVHICIAQDRSHSGTSLSDELAFSSDELPWKWMFHAEYIASLATKCIAYTTLLSKQIDPPIRMNSSAWQDNWLIEILYNAQTVCWILKRARVKIKVNSHTMQFSSRVSGCFENGRDGVSFSKSIIKIRDEGPFRNCSACATLTAMGHSSCQINAYRHDAINGKPESRDQPDIDL